MKTNKTLHTLKHDSNIAGVDSIPKYLEEEKYFNVK